MTRRSDPDEGGESPRISTDHVAIAARAGNREAFDVAYRRVAPALYAWARLRLFGPLRSRFDPEDLVSEVTLKALEGFASWDESKGPYRAWVFGIARHVLRKALERAARETPSGSRPDASRAGALALLPAETTAITRAVVRDENLDRFVRVLEELPDDDRRLLVLRGLEGLRHDEVAAVMNATPDAVAKRWQRLRERLAADSTWLDIVAA